MKLLIWNILVSSVLTACTVATTPISTTIPTYTISSQVETITPTPSAIKINMPTPTSEPTAIIEPTLTEDALNEVIDGEWTTIMDDESTPIEIINLSTGDVIKVWKGAFEWQDTFIIWDEQEKGWMEPVPIHTLEELASQAPTKDEMIELLKSDEVVRATHHLDGKDIPLGVGNEINIFGQYNALNRELEVIIWDKPKLAHLNTPDGSESFLAEFVPAVIPGGSDNLNNPNYILIYLGKERHVPITFAPQATERRKSPPTGSGTHYLYYLSYEDMQEPFIRGRQMGMEVLWGFSDGEAEQKYRDRLNEGGGLAELSRLAFLYYDSFGASMRKALDNLRRGGSLEPGTHVGTVTNIILTASKTKLSDLERIESFDDLLDSE